MYASDKAEASAAEMDKEEAIIRWWMSRPFEFEHGATTLGFIFNGQGIVVAVDHSMTSPAQLPENVLQINSHLLLAFSGGNSDSRDYLLHEFQDKCSKMSITELIEQLVARFRSRPGLSLGILIAGWDSTLGYLCLYKVNGKGECFGDWILGTGSGSVGTGIVVTSRHLGVPWSFTEAIEMAKSALCFGVYGAPECLGYVTVFHIGESGVTTTEVQNEDIQEYQKKDLEERGIEWVDPDTREWLPNCSL